MHLVALTQDCLRSLLQGERLSASALIVSCYSFFALATVAGLGFLLARVDVQIKGLSFWFILAVVRLVD